MSTPKTKPAVQLVLGSQAITFPLPITVTKLDGSEAVVTITCKPLRKTAWAAAKDAHQVRALQHRQGKQAERQAAATDTPTATLADAPAEAEAPTATAANTPADAAQTAFDVAQFFAANGVENTIRFGLESDAQLLLTFATGWDLSDPLTVENIAALEDEFAGTLVKAFDKYDAAIFAGRLGN